jgi:hypothetical protein
MGLHGVVRNVRTNFNTKYGLFVNWFNLNFSDLLGRMVDDNSVISPGFSNAIEIRAKDYNTLVSTITFPEGAPGSTISAPYNDVDGLSSPQVFGGAGVAEPVVTLYNGNASSLTVWYNVTTFTNGVVSEEYYLVNTKGGACADVSCITEAAVFDADTTTGITIGAGGGNEKDLYLKTILNSIAGKSGTSTLTILGETP